LGQWVSVDMEKGIIEVLNSPADMVEKK